MEDHSLRTAPYPFSSPNLASNDFFFGYLKKSLHGSEFQSVEKLLEAVVRILNAIPTDTLIGTFHEWIKTLQAYIDNDGAYVEERVFQSQKLSLKSARYRDAKEGLGHLPYDRECERIDALSPRSFIWSDFVSRNCHTTGVFRVASRQEEAPIGGLLEITRADPTLREGLEGRMRGRKVIRAVKGSC
jgi:hypothetical protein